MDLKAKENWFMRNYLTLYMTDQELRDRWKNPFPARLTAEAEVLRAGFYALLARQE